MVASGTVLGASPSRGTSTIAAVTVVVLLPACGGSGQVGDTPDPTKEPEMVEAMAPIESVQILVAESWPRQYFALVKSGLPNACVKFDRYEVTRAGDTIRVVIVNQKSVGVPCEDVCGTVEHNIPLGGDLMPGATYTVVVNDVTETFVAQGTAPDPGQVAATLDNPFQLKVGQTALIAPQGPIVEFV